MLSSLIFRHQFANLINNVLPVVQGFIQFNDLVKQFVNVIFMFGNTIVESTFF